MKPGVYTAYKKDGTLYYRSSITYKNKHISLGSFDSEDDAHNAYIEATELLSTSLQKIEHYNKKKLLSFDKWVCLINFRDNGIYFKNPIYLYPKYFLYYMSYDEYFTFDVDDLFYYSNHKIMRRGGHLFVADYGMQVNILNRYGIKNFAKPGKDYVFVNGDDTDFRYRNIHIINHYNGVTKSEVNGRAIYTAKIHINGDYIIGKYDSEDDAAIAYNKAVDILEDKGVNIRFTKNYIDGLNQTMYDERYEMIKISKKIKNYEYIV